MKIFKYLFAFLLVLWAGQAFAADPDTFLVEVIPSTFQVGEAVDLRISAVDSDGNTVTDYDGDIFITANVFDGEQYTVPNDGIYTFLEEDQGSKLFSKGLIIEEAGEFKVVVEDILGLVNGDASVVVQEAGGGQGSNTTDDATVTVLSPAPGTIVESTGSLNVIGESSLPNTPVWVRLNGVDKDVQSTTDANGGFNVYVDGLVAGDNTLVVLLKNVAGEVLGQSSQVTISLEEQEEEEIVQSFFVQPQSDLYVGDLFTAGVITSDAVGSVEVTVGANKFPMDRFGVGQFGKEISLQFPGTYAVQVHAYVDGQKFSFPQDPIKILEKIDDTDTNQGGGGTDGGTDGNTNGGATNNNTNGGTSNGGGSTNGGTTNQGSNNQGGGSTQGGSNNQGGSTNQGNDQNIVGVGLIGHMQDPVNRGTVNVFWEPIGEIDFFVVRHGTSPAFLDKEIVVVDTGITLTGLEPETTIYVQVWPADSDGNTLGVPSDALTIDVRDIAPPCVVKGIALSTEKKGDTYYLVWDAVDNATEYVIYRSDFEVSLLTEMQEIGRTDLTAYPYPFDPTTTNYEYAYYAVEAHCEGGNSAPIDEIKKVQVGPTANIIAIMIISALLYFLYRINYYRNFDV